MSNKFRIKFAAGAVVPDQLKVSDLVGPLRQIKKNIKSDMSSQEITELFNHAFGLKIVCEYACSVFDLYTLIRGVASNQPISQAAMDAYLTVYS